MASRVQLDALGHSDAQTSILALSRTLLEPCHLEGRKTHCELSDFDGLAVTAQFERKPGQSTPLSAVNFDVETTNGTVRCGSNAFTTACLVYGTLQGNTKRLRSIS